MRLARTLPRFVTIVLVFALMVTAAQTNIVQEKRDCEPTVPTQAPAPRTVKCKTITTKGGVVTIILHGLMLGRYRNGGDEDKRFELGIVKRSPNHKFAFDVYTEGKGCEPVECDPSTICIEGCDISKMLKKGGSWVFEIKDEKKRNIKMWHPDGPSPGEQCRPGATRDVMTPGQEEDSKHILNIEGKCLHDDRNMPRFKRPFKPVFYFHHGEVKSKCLTSCLTAQQVEKKGNKPEIRIYRIAEVIKVEIRGDKGKKLVLRRQSDDERVIDDEKVAWEHTFDGSTTQVEGRVLNLDSYHTQHYPICSPYPCETLGTTEDPETEPEDMNATDFQLFYHLVFKKNRPDRFELKIQKDGPELRIREAPGKDPTFKAPTPHRCGMGLVQEGSKAINFEKQDDVQSP